MDPARQAEVARQNGQNGRPEAQRPAAGNQPEQRTAMVRAQEPRGSAPARPATGPAGGSGPEATRKVDAAAPKPGQPGPGQNGGPGRGAPGQNGHGPAGNGQNSQNGNHNGQNGQNGNHNGQDGQNGQGPGRPPRSPEATVLTSAKPGEAQKDGSSAGRSPSGSRNS
jgi:hypothetical protein